MSQLKRGSLLGLSPEGGAIPVVRLELRLIHPSLHELPDNVCNLGRCSRDCHGILGGKGPVNQDPIVRENGFIRLDPALHLGMTS